MYVGGYSSFVLRSAGEHLMLETTSSGDIILEPVSDYVKLNPAGSEITIGSPTDDLKVFASGDMTIESDATIFFDVGEYVEFAFQDGDKATIDMGNANHIIIPVATTDPTDSKVSGGSMYYNSATNKIKVYESGTGWVTV
jgi:hypothetical protein